MSSGQLVADRYSPQTFRRCGQSGLEIADTYPNLQQCADDLAVVRSCYHESFNHAPAQYMMSTGASRMGHPCMGSWVTYGLGSESSNLPAFVVMANTGDVKGGPPVFDRGFLPGTYQPTVLRNAGAPVLYLDRPDNRSAADQRFEDRGLRPEVVIEPTLRAACGKTDVIHRCRPESLE